MGDSFDYPESDLRYDKEEYETADRICVPSRFVARTFTQLGVPEQKLFINPYGVDFGFWSACDPVLREQSPFTFLYVASIGLRKGIVDLLDAWKKAGVSHARLVFVGGVSIEARPFMKSLPKNVELLGYASHEKIRDLMGRSHAYILPSYEEGMARSVLEAAAAGLPVIVTEETGATDILQDGRDGWVVPSGNVDALVAALRDAAEEADKTTRRGESAQESVRPYTWEAYGRRAATFLTNLLSCGANEP